MSINQNYLLNHLLQHSNPCILAYMQGLVLLGCMKERNIGLIVALLMLQQLLHILSHSLVYQFSLSVDGLLGCM